MATINLNLQSNESVILHEYGISPVNHESGFSYELYLTTLNLILVKTKSSLFNKSVDIKKYPLCQIKESDGLAQTVVTKNQDGDYLLHIHLNNGVIVFEFDNKRTIRSFVDGINSVRFGKGVSSASSAIPGVDTIAETLKDTFGSSKKALGVKSKTEAEENTTAKCIGCRATLSGRKGQQVKCSYCDTVQTL